MYIQPSEQTKLLNKSIFLNESKYLFDDITRTSEKIIIIGDMNVNSTD